MSRLNIWNENNIKDRISICLKGESSGSYAQENLTFPLSDILFSFYQTANIIEDFYSLESFEKILAQYKADNKEFTESTKELAEKGWILFSFGRWECALSNLYTWEDIEREGDWEFRDSSIILFSFG